MNPRLRSSLLALLWVLLFTVGATSAGAQFNLFGPTGSLVTHPRSQHTATLLGNGTVLIAGGIGNSATPPATSISLASAELYDPTTLAFATTGNMIVGRYAHTATLLSNGKVLIAGGVDSSGNTEAIAELYDPTSGVFTVTRSMTIGRYAHTAALLTNGKVLISGGVDPSGNTEASAELYDPASGAFTVTGSMATGRKTHTATVLGNGKVLIAGGANGTSAELASAELYDPSTGMFSATGNMTDPRYSHTATLLSTGKVLVAGGWGVATMGNCEESPAWNTAELYDPMAGTFTPTGSMLAHRYLHTARLLSNNLVLVAAGDMGPTFNPDCGLEYPPTLSEADLYDPVAGTFSQTASLNFAREMHTATLLNDGTVLIAGGTAFFNGDPTPSAELFESTFASWGPPYLSFGDVTVGAPTQIGPQVTLLDSIAGYAVTSALNITQVTVSGTNPSDFTPTNNHCLGSVAVGATCTINVSFTPGAAGTRTANLVIVNNNNSSHALKVPLSGTGTTGPPTVTLSTSTIVFGVQAPQTSSAPLPVYITNSGNGVLNIQNVSVGSSSDFAIGNGTTCTSGSSVAVDAFCTIQVVFTPGTTGQKSATLTISDNAPNSPQQVSLSGGSPGVTLSVSRASVSFASQLVGTSSLPQNVTLTNTSSLPLTITNVAASPSDFATVSGCGSTLAGNSSCSIGVFFGPTAGGARTGTLTITDNGIGSPQTVALSGTGQDFSMTAASTNATVSAGQSATYSVAVAPTGGFTQNVSLSCSGGPAMSTCLVSPSAIQLSGTGAKIATVTVTTAAPAWVMPLSGGKPISTRRQTQQTFGELVVAVFVFVALLWWRREQRPRMVSAFAMALLVCLGGTLSSCGGGSGSGGGNLGAQTGTYTITVTGNYSSGSKTVTNSTKLTLVVQ